MKADLTKCSHGLFVLMAALCTHLSWPVTAAETLLRMSSEPGDYIGGGQQHFYAPTGGSFTASRNFDQGVAIRFSGSGHSWNLDFAAPGDQPLMPGTYSGAARFPFQSPNQPGLSVSGDGRGCNTLTGQFRVKAVSYGAGSAVNSFWGLFEQHCEGAAPALTGEIRFNADVVVAVSAPFNRSVERGQLLSFQVTATDLMSRRVLLSASNLPPGATFTDNGDSTGSFTWPVGRGQFGAYQVSFQGNNGAGGTDSATTDINVVGYTSLAMSSDSGDFIGQGQQYFYGLSNGTMSVRRNSDSGISIGFAGWSLDFAAPFGQPLMTGVYTGATRWPFQADDRAGLSISGQGRGCNALTGSFDVRQLEYGPNNDVRTFWAFFEQHCEGATPALRGELRYNADVFVSVTAPAQVRAEVGALVTFDVQGTSVTGGTVSLSAPNLPSGASFTEHGNNTGTFSWAASQPGIHRVTFLGHLSMEDAGHATTLIYVAGPTVLIMNSDGGDYIGAGGSYFFTPNEGVLNVSGNSNRVSARFDGSGYNFNLDFAAPSGQALRPGAYVGATRYPFQAPTQPGLSVSGNGRGCNTLTGQFTVQEVSFLANNSVRSFWATFEQHCEGATPALRGEVRYNASVLSNQPPVLGPIPPQTVDEGVRLTLTIVATDNDVPTNRLTFSLGQGAPANAGINPTTGIFTWTPTEGQGPSTTAIPIIVTDDGTPSLSATQTMSVVVNEVNSAPVLLPVPSSIGFVLSQLRLTNLVIDTDVPANRLSFGLGSGPSGARINANSGVFTWIPSRAQAASSNFVTVIVTDEGLPPLRATNNFTVIVDDFLELSLGSTVVRVGEPGSVPIVMASSVGVTNLNFALEASEVRLTNFALQQLPADVSGSLVPSGTNRWLVSFSAAGGQSLLGNRQLGSLAFTATAVGPSAFIPLVVADLTATRGNSTAVPRTIPNGGRVVIVGAAPLLEGVKPAIGQRALILYGIPQTSYTLESKSDASSPIWNPTWQGTLTNLFHRLDDLTVTDQIILYRALRQ